MEFKVSFGVIGKGKTGSAVIEVLGNRVSQVFSKSNPVTLERITKLNALIVFVPAEGLEAILPVLIESQVPVVCGTTGFRWPDYFSAILKEKKSTWIIGSNFSPGMNFLFTVANLIKQNREFLGNPNLSIHDLHHVHKRDAPSGTALKWNEALGGEARITSERMGDHPGLHELTLDLAYEKIQLIHSAKDRRAFAEGAVYAAEKLLPSLSAGLYTFEELMKNKILTPEGVKA